MDLAYRLVNVFGLGAERFSGNPLAVFETEGAPLEDATMLAVARELNLSETTFVERTVSGPCDARVRIFTPTYEMPFAGHPTLGTAFVVGERLGGPEAVTLGMKAGPVRVTLDGARPELRAARPPATRPWTGGSVADLARALALPESALSAAPLWVDAGVEQLVVRLASPEHVLAMNADPLALLRHARSERTGEGMVYAFADAGEGQIVARFVFSQHASLVEDPATGSACANLGGYLLAEGARGPFRRLVRQGAAVGRPSELHLRVDDAGVVHVGGLVRAAGRGVLTV